MGTHSFLELRLSLLHSSCKLLSLHIQDSPESPIPTIPNSNLNFHQQQHINMRTAFFVSALASTAFAGIVTQISDGQIQAPVTEAAPSVVASSAPSAAASVSSAVESVSSAVASSVVASSVAS